MALKTRDFPLKITRFLYLGINTFSAIINVFFFCDKPKQIRFWGTYDCVYKKKLDQCPGDGGWTEWSAWSPCKAECEDKGWQTRNRICENPKPKFGGEQCEGVTTMNRTCSGSCHSNANGQEEAKDYITRIHSLAPDLEELCIKKHCYYEEVQKIIRDKSKVDKYWSSIICVKYNGPCPVNGGWGTWEEWSTCSVQCGHGEQFHKRECNTPTPKNGGIFCVGKYFETKICLTKNCTIYDSYTGWSDYSICSESCGAYGIKTSIRSCLNEKNCYIGGTLVKEQVKAIPCYGGECPQIGGWGKWSLWAACSARCGEGRRGRMRMCDNPPPSSGEECPGANVFVESCSGSYCVQLPADPYGRRRRRSSIILTPSDHTKNNQPIIKPEQIYSNKDSYWKIKQKENSSPSRTLFVNDKKIQDKPEDEKFLFGFTRKFPKNISALVSNMEFRVATETVRRNDTFLEDRNSAYELLRHRIKRKAKTAMPPVKVDEDDPFNLPLNPDLELLYTEWSKWSVCTKTCGGGTRRRKRKCKNKKAVCRGEVWPMQFCNVDPCPVAGGWGAWMSWTPCSVTCGSGVIERYRACNNPLPSFGGSCSGLNSQSQSCSYPKCKGTHPVMSDWSVWSDCSTSCGGGLRVRKRFYLILPLMEASLCNPVPCPVNGLWAAWGGWSTCSLPCGLGSTFRDRTCTDPAPIYGGDPCNGAGSELQTCFAGPCIDEDDYGVLLRGTGYLKYRERGIFTGFLMVFLRIKIMQEKGTLFHHTNKCGSDELSNCELSILLTMAGRTVQLEVNDKKSAKQTFLPTTNLEMDEWHDIFVMVTDSWMAICLNDDTYTVKTLSPRLKHGLNFDGELFVGSNRLKQDGIHGIIGVLRRNFKVLLLFSMKSWLGYGAPAESSNIDKFQLPLNVRHPNFKGKYYSHLLFRKSTFLQLTIIFHLTSIDGLLLFNGGMETNSSASVTVKDGAIEFCLNCGEKLLCRKAYELKIGQWYVLRISVNGNEEQIRMNDGDAMQIMCPAGDKYVPRSAIYVGGAGALDWKIILELTKNDDLFHGMIDTLFVNGVAVTYKMACLIDISGMVNSLGYSLADHVTEVHESERTTTTLRCGVPALSRNTHIVRIIWLQNMKRIVSGVGTEIVESESFNQTVSTISLHSSHHYEGVYACLLSSDGVLVNFHVFILSRYKYTDGDAESSAEWIIFIILLVLIAFVCCPLVIYYCTKDHPFWDKLRQKIAQITKKGKEELKPLLNRSDTSGTTTGGDSSVANTSGADTSGTSASGSSFSRTNTPGTSTSQKDTSGVSTSNRSTPSTPGTESTPGIQSSPGTPRTDTSGGTAGENTPGSLTPDMDKKTQSAEQPKAMMMGMDQTPVEESGTAMMSGSEDTGMMTTVMDDMQTSTGETTLTPGIRKKLSFADQISIVMPPTSGQQDIYEPDFQPEYNSQCFGLNYDNPCPPYFQDGDPYSTWELCQPPCEPSFPSFNPCDVYGIQEPSSKVIQHVDFLRNPYYISGIFNHFNVNQNNPTRDHSTNNANSDYSKTILCDQSDRPVVVESEGIHIADKDVKNYENKRLLCLKETWSSDTGTPCSKANKRWEADQSLHFDGEFASHSDQRNDIRSKVCNLPVIDINIASGINEDSTDNTDMEEENIASFSQKNQNSKQLLCTNQSFYSRSQNLRHSQQLHHQDRSHEEITHLRKELLMQSVVSSECKNLMSASRERGSSEKLLTEQITAIDSELISVNNSVTVLSSQMLAPTSDVIRSLKRRHRRTRSVSKGPDISSASCDHGEGLHRACPNSVTTSSQTHSSDSGSLVLQVEENGVQLRMDEKIKYVQVRKGQVSVKETRQEQP